MRALFLTTALCLAGCESCGYTSVDNKLTGQVKKIHHNTPIACPDYDNADVSLGVMRNGVGSMSTQDVHVTIVNPADLEVMKQAAENGRLVEIVYKERRATTCIDDYVVDSVRILEDDPKADDKTEE